MDAEEVGGHHVFLDAAQFHPRVHRTHRLHVDAAGELVQHADEGGRTLLQRQPIQVDRLVARKVTAVVAQRAQVVVGDLRVGAVQVDRVDRTAGHRAVRQRVVEAAHLRLRQAVAPAQAGPAIAAVHELVGEAEAQVGMLQQVGNGLDAQPCGFIAAHADRIGVAEAERVGDADPQRLEPRAQGGDVRVRRHALQQFLGERAGVLGVGVDLAFEQGAPEDAGAAQFAPMHRIDAGLARTGQRQFAEDHRLGELLGADAHRRVLRRRGRQACAQQQDQRG